MQIFGKIVLSFHLFIKLLLFFIVKTSKKTIFFIPIVCYTGSFAQTYFPFPDSGVVWSVLYEQQSSPNDYSANTEHYFINSDTFINNRNYHKLYSTNDSVRISSGFTLIEPVITRYVGAIREDSLKRIFFIGSSPHCGANSSTYENLLYWFGRNVGDTVITDSADSIKVIQNIDSVLVNGKYRKRYLINRWGTFEVDYWIEGIGSTKGLFSLFCIEFENYFNLLCFKQSGMIFHPDTSNKVCSILVGIKEKKENENPIIIYPNPFRKTSSLYIHSILEFTKMVMKIYDLLGREIKQFEIVNTQSEIQGEGLPNGIYIYKIIHEKEIISKGKLVVQD